MESKVYKGIETLWYKYNDIVQVNKSKRISLGQWKSDEPAELIYDENTPESEVIIEADGCPQTISWDWTYSNLYSEFWVADWLGADMSTVQRLLSCNNKFDIVFVDGYIYYREQFLVNCFEILRLLAQTNIVTSLRPIPQIVKEISSPIYTSKDLMQILNVKDSTLRKYRDDGLLGYTKYGDKIWYTQEDLDKFLHLPTNRYEAFNT